MSLEIHMAGNTSQDIHKDNVSYIVVLCQWCGLASDPLKGEASVCPAGIPPQRNHFFQLQGVPACVPGTKNFAERLSFLVPSRKQLIQDPILCGDKAGDNSDFPHMVEKDREFEYVEKSSSAYFLESEVTNLLIVELREMMEKLSIKEMPQNQSLRDEASLSVHSIPNENVNDRIVYNNCNLLPTEMEDCIGYGLVVIDDDSNSKLPPGLHQNMNKELSVGVAVQISWKFPGDELPAPSWFDGIVKKISGASIKIGFSVSLDSSFEAEVWTHTNVFISSESICIKAIPGAFRLRPEPGYVSPGSEVKFPSVVCCRVPSTPCRMFDALVHIAEGDVFALEFLHDGSYLRCEQVPYFKYVLKENVNYEAIRSSINGNYNITSDVGDYILPNQSSFNYIEEAETELVHFTCEPKNTNLNEIGTFTKIDLPEESSSASCQSVGWLDSKCEVVPQPTWNLPAFASPKYPSPIPPENGPCLYVLTTRGVVLAAWHWSMDNADFTMFGSMVKIYWLDGRLKRIDFMPPSGSMIIMQSEVLLTGCDEQSIVAAASRVQLTCATCGSNKNADQFPIEGKLRKVRCRGCKTADSKE